MKDKTMRPTLMILAGAASLALGACAYDGTYYGRPVGGAYADAAYDPGICWDYGWSGWAGPALPYCGWYGGYFYPGYGIYVYDLDHRRIRWNGSQQAYWTQRAQAVSASSPAARPFAARPERQTVAGRAAPPLGMPRPAIPHPAIPRPATPRPHLSIRG